MKNKKGFTLIELLAVIVILAIIALIATPIVLNIINNVQKSAFMENIKAINRTIEMANVKTIDAIEYTSLDNLPIKIKDDIELKVVYEKGKTYYYDIKNNSYMIDITKCETKKYCTIEEITTIKDIIITRTNQIQAEQYEKVNDSNPGIICGTGTEEDTAETTCYIKSIEDLVAFSSLVNNGDSGNNFSGKTIELTYNLDFSNANSYASKQVNQELISGNGFTPIGNVSKYFSGTFDGKNKIIKGLYIDKSEANYVGLFGYSNIAIIKNINVIDSIIKGNEFVGGIIGYNRGTIKNIRAGKINVLGSQNVGGIVGYNTTGSGATYSGVVKNITVSDGEVNGANYTGGIVGYATQGNTSNLVYYGNVIGESYVGLAIGYLNGLGDNIIVKGNVKGTEYVGGLVGQQYFTNTLSGAYLGGTVTGTTNVNRITYNSYGYIKALSFDKVTVNGVEVTTGTISNNNGKSLTDMGIASQSEYEAIGFEFASTDTNEAYWYFNDDDVISLIVK